MIDRDHRVHGRVHDCREARFESSSAALHADRLAPVFAASLHDFGFRAQRLAPGEPEGKRQRGEVHRDRRRHDFRMLPSGGQRGHVERNQRSRRGDQSEDAAGAGTASGFPLACSREIDAVNAVPGAGRQSAQIMLVTEPMEHATSELVIDPMLIRKYDVSGPRYTSYPTADRFVEAFGEDQYANWLGKRNIGGISQPLSLYLHLPFCANICYYCACNKVVTKDHGRSGKYIKYLARELALVAGHLGGERAISQIHWGRHADLSCAGGDAP